MMILNINTAFTALYQEVMVQNSTTKIYHIRI